MLVLQTNASKSIERGGGSTHKHPQIRAGRCAPRREGQPLAGSRGGLGARGRARWYLPRATAGCRQQQQQPPAPPPPPKAGFSQALVRLPACRTLPAGLLLPRRLCRARPASLTPLARRGGEVTPVQLPACPTLPGFARPRPNAREGHRCCCCCFRGGAGSEVEGARPRLARCRSLRTEPRGALLASLGPGPSDHDEAALNRLPTPPLLSPPIHVKVRSPPTSQPPFLRRARPLGVGWGSKAGLFCTFVQFQAIPRAALIDARKRREPRSLAAGPDSTARLFLSATQGLLTSGVRALALIDRAASGGRALACAIGHRSSRLPANGWAPSTSGAACLSRPLAESHCGKESWGSFTRATRVRRNL